MPFVQVILIAGYADEIKRRLSARLTDAVAATIAAPLDAITVAISEVAPSAYMRGRAARAPGAPRPSGEEIVRQFLAAMEERNLDRARTFLADGFEMEFPGGARFRSLEELVERSKTRYRFVHKTFDAVDECFAESGLVVWCQGTLAGEWPDGTAFSGIRFVDRFEIVEGRLRRQQVWNDLAEAGSAKVEKG